MANEYADDRVMIIEILLSARSPKDLQEYVGKHDYFVVRTNPKQQMQEDFEKTEIFLGCGHTSMINLLNMTVMEHTCGTTVAEAEACIQKYL